MSREIVETDDGSGILAADSITCHLCETCPAVHINFLDPDGEVFATASVAVSDGKKFIRMFRECLRESGTRAVGTTTRQ